MAYESARGRNELIDRVTSIGPAGAKEGGGCRVEVRCCRIGKQVVEGVDNIGRLVVRHTPEDGGGGKFRRGGSGPRCEDLLLWPTASLKGWRGQSAGGNCQGNKG